MRLPIVAALIAITASCGVAVAVPMLETTSPIDDASVALGTPSSPVLVLQPGSLDATVASAAASTTPVSDLVHAAKHIVTFQGGESADKHLPRYLLLPDGALLTASAADETPLARGVVLREAPAAPAPEPRAPPLPLPAAQLARIDDAGPSTYFQGQRTSAPDAAPLPRATAFQPQAMSSAGSGGSYWVATGLAALGAATVLGFALYHRIRPTAALENETRKTIFESVCAQPGLGVHEVSKLAGVSYSTATYHLERLVGAGMIVMTPDGNKLCYYKNGGAFTESERRILPLIKNEEAAKLFEAILQSPGTYRAALAEQLGVTATTINWHLRRLRAAGLVDETRQGRSAHLYAKIDALRPVFLTLATKVETTEPTIAVKLRTYAVPSPGSPTSASA